MKLLNVSKCHEDSPTFRSGLSQLEVIAWAEVGVSVNHPGDTITVSTYSCMQGATKQLEKRLRRICSICEERQALAERDHTLSLRKSSLISQ